MRRESEKIEKMKAEGREIDQPENQGRVGTRTPGDHERSESAQSNDHDQKHENRENPDQDHVPGHKGYGREHQANVNPTRREP